MRGDSSCYHLWEKQGGRVSDDVATNEDKGNASSSNGETMATVQSEATLKTLEQYRHCPTTYLTRLA
jgi:hypothetical protein